MLLLSLTAIIIYQQRTSEGLFVNGLLINVSIPCLAIKMPIDGIIILDNHGFVKLYDDGKKRV